MTAPNYGGWTDDKAAERWEETMAVMYVVDQLKAGEITDVEAIELGAALRNVAELDKAQFPSVTENGVTEAPYIVDGSDTSMLSQLLDSGYGEGGVM